MIHGWLSIPLVGTVSGMLLFVLPFLNTLATKNYLLTALIVINFTFGFVNAVLGCVFIYLYYGWFWFEMKERSEQLNQKIWEAYWRVSI